MRLRRGVNRNLPPSPYYGGQLTWVRLYPLTRNVHFGQDSPSQLYPLPDSLDLGDQNDRTYSSPSRQGIIGNFPPSLRDNGYKKTQIPGTSTKIIQDTPGAYPAAQKLLPEECIPLSCHQELPNRHSQESLSQPVPTPNSEENE